MRRVALAVLCASLASIAVAQAVPGGPQTPQPNPDTPRGGSSGGGGIGGIGLSISLGKKKPGPVPLPPIQMRDAQIPDDLPDQVIFVTTGPVAGVDKFARTTRVTVIESTLLDEAGVTMHVALLSPGDSVAAAVARLEKVKGVGWAQANHQFQLLGGKLPKRFALHAISPKQPSISGKVVMIDAPVDLGHDNLKGASLSQQFFGVAQAPAMHGTVVAALLVGTGAYPGTAQGARLTSLAAFGPAASGVSLSRTSYLAKAMNEASRLRPDVLNLSFGGPEDRLLALMLDTIRRNGVCVAAAAGNGGPKGRVLFPATHPASLAVTAVDENLRGYAFASQGPRVDVSGVGVGLNAAVPGGRRAVSGTSFATAVLSGALLRMPACNGGRNPAGMKAQVAALAQDLGVPGRDAVFGAGLFRLSASAKK